ncbi:cell wall elongation regulator TseB-like domain-containing protein [Paenibacillus silviterrae]|uniref:cell wall elongation regulator TseB-like domain-containing protein n=1 Tax=Paenibacillus silviterrae TaxID=3242194 RepID=UPI002543D222|nr:DUF5590 domain-containing protein [Paenibacillus chinjuensis]
MIAKRWKWITLIVVAVSLGIFLSAKMFTGIMEPEWSVQRAAVQQAYEKTILAKADKVERFVGDQIYTVIQGKDKIGQPVIVWVSENDIRTEMASSGITSEQAKQGLLSQQPDAEILRIQPGILDGQPVWEVFYKREPEGEKEKHYYTYYKFTDGSLIDTWRLNIQ